MKKKFHREIPVQILFLFLSFTSTAQAAENVVFEAQVQPDRVQLGETVQLTVQASTDNPDLQLKYSPPDLQDFEVLQFVPQQSTQWIESGRGRQVKHVAAYTYVLRPKRKGTLRIGKAKLWSSTAKRTPPSTKVSSRRYGPTREMWRDASGWRVTWAPALAQVWPAGQPPQSLRASLCMSTAPGARSAS